MKPFAMGGIYVNNLGDEREDRIRGAYGSAMIASPRSSGNMNPTTCSGEIRISGRTSEFATCDGRSWHRTDIRLPERNVR